MIRIDTTFPLVGTPTPLTRDDLARLPAPHVTPVQVLAESHRRVARLLAAGLRVEEVAERSGYSTQRIYTLRRSPAFIELVETFRAEIDANFVRKQDDYYQLARGNMVTAERIIADRLDDPDCAIPTKDLLAIARDAADRFGYGKKKLEIRANFDFAAKMEEAARRSTPRELEHEA